jgi:7-cyano-7-deazaguanine synthase
MQEKILLILSGGMDSFTLLHHALHQDLTVECIIFSYGQRHIKEVKLAVNACQQNNLDYLEIKLDSIESIFSHSALVSSSLEVPHGSYKSETMQATIVPNRNMLFISYAIAYAISRGVEKVWYGAHAGDHFIYPDCRPEFLESMNNVAQKCHTTPITVQAPFLHLTKAEIVKLGLDINLDYSQTWTCYEGQTLSCGKCGSCNERLEAFLINDSVDPLQYQS